MSTHTQLTHTQSTHTEHADVIVVGARAAGASTAMLLARAGLSVLVLDQAPFRADTLSTHALMRGGVLQLARWGLLDRIIAAGTPAIRHTTFHYTATDIAIAIKPSPGVDALYAPRRTVLDPILAAAASAAGATLRYGVTVTGLHRGHDGRVNGVRARDEHGRAVTISARLVIGADGRRSIVARDARAEIAHRGANTTAFVYGYWSQLATDGYEWAYRPGATAGFIPTNDGHTCVFAGSLPAQMGRGGKSTLESIVERASPDMGARLRSAVAPTGVRSFAGHPGYLRRPWGPGWALVGDAGSWKDAISAHGLTDAFRDAELLAQAVVESATGNAPEHNPYATYEAIRDRLTLPMLRAADEIAAFRWDDGRIVELLGALSAAMTEELEIIEGFGSQPLVGASSL
jgi:2-polyprenyl-6-methoxyphenol hydroxylase-like FAD-dependent oxidoreductase